MRRRRNPVEVKRAARGHVGVGLFFEPIAPLMTIDANIRLARASGADDIWLADHTKSLLPTAAWDPKTNPLARLVPELDAYLDPTALITRYAGKGGMSMGTCVTDSVRRTPQDLARAWLSMHHVTKGHAILGIGSGEAENTVPYGLPLDKPVSRLEDVLSAVRAAWGAGSAPLTHHGPYHTWKDATFALPGWRNTYPPVWVAAQGPRGAGIAGRYGDGWIHIHESFERWEAGWSAVQNGATAAGRDPHQMERSLLIATLLVPNEEDLRIACTRPTVQAFALAMRGSAWTAAGAQHPFGRDFGGFSEITPDEITTEAFAEVRRVLTPEIFRRLMPCGRAEDVATHLRRFVDAGVTHVTILNLAPTCGLTLAAKSVVEQTRLIRRLKRVPLQATNIV